MQISVYIRYSVLFLFLVGFPPAAALALSFSEALEANEAHKHNFSASANYTTTRTVDGSENTDHPYAASSAAGGTEEICVFCHTPHNAEAQSPLWGRPDPDSMGSFPLYNSPLVIKGDYPGSPAGIEDATQYKDDGSVIYPNGASKLCLSCHDGVTAIGAQLDGFGAEIAMANVSVVSADSVVDLQFSHPISFVYTESIKNQINTTREANGETADQYQRPGDAGSPLGFDVVPLDSTQRMQCTTCHDPHDDTGLEATFGPAGLALPFWRNTSSAPYYDNVCDSCHAEPPAVVGPPNHGLK